MLLKALEAMYGLLSSKQAAGDGKARRAAIGNLCSDLTPLHAPSDSSGPGDVASLHTDLRDGGGGDTVTQL